VYRLQIHEHFSKIPKSIRPARPRTQHGCHHDTKVKPEAATAVIELLMMGGRTPETCWVVNKRQDNKLENCYIWLVIYLNCTMMHGLKNLKTKSNQSVPQTYSDNFKFSHPVVFSCN